MLDGIVGGEAELGSTSAKQLRRPAQKSTDGMPVVLSDGGDVRLKGLVVNRDPRLLIRGKQPGGLACDLTVKEGRTLRADSHNPDVAAQLGTKSFLGKIWGIAPGDRVAGSA